MEGARRGRIGGEGLAVTLEVFHVVEKISQKKNPPPPKKKKKKKETYYLLVAGLAATLVTG